MKLEEFIRSRSEPRNIKYKTVNLDEDLHLFFKRTANHYNIALVDLMYSILTNWKNNYEKEIQDDVISDFEN